MKVEGPGAQSPAPLEGTYKVPLKRVLPAIGESIRDLLLQKGLFRAPKGGEAQALADALGIVAERLEGGAGAVKSEQERAAMLKEIPLARTLTHRRRELPHRVPAGMHVGTAGRPVDLSRLDPSKVHLWVLDAEGRFLVAEERPDGASKKVNHGDMCPGPEGKARGAARAGGELRARQEDGKTIWSIDLSSSFSFNRMDLEVLGDRHLATLMRYLAATGMDLSALRPGKNTFDAIYRIAGFQHLVQYYAGVGAPR